MTDVIGRPEIEICTFRLVIIKNRFIIVIKNLFLIITNLKAVSYTHLFDAEMMLLAELVPVCLLTLRQNQDDVQCRVIFMKTLYAALQDGMMYDHLMKSK